VSIKAFLTRASVPLAVTVLALGAASGAGAADTKSAAPADPSVLATVNGKAVTQADVEAAASAQLKQLESEYQKNRHDLIENTLTSVVQQRLLDAEAAATGKTKDQLLADIKPAAVTDADVDAFYEQNKAQIPRPKDQVAGQIKAYLEQQGQGKARETYFAGLQQKYPVDIKLEPVRVAVDAIGPSRGPANAPVTIVEFSDFQCPFCGRLKPTMDQVLAKYGDKVHLVFRQYPLPFHQNAQKAAEAALCAADQGKFWELHDAMFTNQQALAVTDLKAKAKELGMNADTFGQCVDSGAKAGLVLADVNAGSAVGVNGTPAMFVNGRFINGAVPLEDITKVIDDELRRHGAK
jgi:protein-disulfide isomerase